MMKWLIGLVGMPDNTKDKQEAPTIVRRSLLKSTGATIGSTLVASNAKAGDSATQQGQNWEYQSDVQFVEIGYIHKNAPKENTVTTSISPYTIDKQEQKLYLTHTKKSTNNKFKENDRIVKSNKFQTIPATTVHNAPKFALVVERNRRLLPTRLSSVVKRYNRPDIKVESENNNDIIIKTEEKSKTISDNANGELKLSDQKATISSRPQEHSKPNDKSKRQLNKKYAGMNKGRNVDVQPIVLVQNHGVLEVYNAS